MRKIFFAITTCVLLVVFCGAPQAPTETTQRPGENIAYGTLTEPELQKFIKALPVFVEEMEKEFDAGDTPRDFMAAMATLSTLDKEVAGLDSKLKTAGMAWAEFWPAFAKTMTAVGAVMFDSAMTEMKKEMSGSEGEIAKLEAKLKDPKVSEAEKQMIKISLEMMKSVTAMVAQADSVFKNIPQVNKNLVKKYQTDLTDLFDDID
jgi:hypothetical protein